MMNSLDPDNLNQKKKTSKGAPDILGKTRPSRKERIARAMANYAAAPEGLRTSDEMRDVMRKRGLHVEKARPGTELLFGRTPGPKRSGRIETAVSISGRTARNSLEAAPDGVAKFIRANTDEATKVVKRSRFGDPLALKDGFGNQKRARIVRVKPDNSPPSPAEPGVTAKRTNEMKAAGYVEPPAYDPKPGEGRAVSYQNLMRELGYLNTQDFAGQQELFQKEASKDALRDFSNSALTAAEVAGLYAALYAPHPLAKGVGLAVSIAAAKILENRERNGKERPAQ